jgi:hypothetical protein
MMNIMVTVDSDDEDVLIDIMEDGEQHVYKYKIDSDIDGDSIHMIINAHMDDFDCKDVEKIMMMHGSGSGSAVFITDDGNVQVLDEDITKTMRIKTIGAAQTAVFTNFVPLFGILLGALLLNEQISHSMLLGGALVIIGVILTNRR